MGVLLFFLPVVCWSLAGRGTALRIGLCLALAAIAGVQAAVMEQWFLGDKRFTIAGVLAVVVVGLLVGGWILDQPGRSVRVVAGLIATAAWSVLSLLAVAILVAVSAIGGPSVSTPSDDLLLPLPSGLVVLDNTAEVCAGGDGCGRTITVGGAAGETDVPGRVLRYLSDRGWSLWFHEPSRTWNDCRTFGWWLDRRWVCVSVQGGPTTTVRLESRSQST